MQTLRSQPRPAGAELHLNKIAAKLCYSHAEMKTGHRAGGRGEGGGLEVRGAVRWRGRETVPSRTAKVLTMRKSLRVKADRTLTRQMKF